MIVICCGPPGSGKTTLATGLRRRLAARGYRFEVRHSDDYDDRTYDRLFAAVADVEERVGDDRDWLLDGTFYRREWRTRFYRLDDVFEVWVRASLETCLERTRDRAASIPQQGVGAIYRSFEPPRADLEIDTEALDVDAALDRLETAALEWLDADR